MPSPSNDPSPATDPAGAGSIEEALPTSPVPGRGRPFAEAGLRHLRDSWALKVCAMVAFMCYGGLAVLLVAGKLGFSQVTFVAVLSLGSWFFLFWYLPVLERTIQRLGPDPRRMAIGGVLEIIAVSCVVLVHVLMAVILVHAARS